jgi:sulfite reductase (NADPH) hemoprotein beta-component
MYQYSPEDSKFLVERVDQFEKQLKRHLDGDLDAAKFRKETGFIWNCMLIC